MSEQDRPRTIVPDVEAFADLKAEWELPEAQKREVRIQVPSLQTIARPLATMWSASHLAPALLCGTVSITIVCLYATPGLETQISIGAVTLLCFRALGLAAKEKPRDAPGKGTEDAAGSRRTSSPQGSAGGPPDQD